MLLLPRTGQAAGKRHLPMITVSHHCGPEAVAPAAEQPVQEPRTLPWAAAAAASAVFTARGTSRAGEKGLFFLPTYQFSISASADSSHIGKGDLGNVFTGFPCQEQKEAWLGDTRHNEHKRND